MSRRKIKNLNARRSHQLATRGMTNAKRKAWGSAGRPMRKDGTAREVEETKRGSGRKIRVEPKEVATEVQAVIEDDRR